MANLFKKTSIHLKKILKEKLRMLSMIKMITYNTFIDISIRSLAVCGILVFFFTLSSCSKEYIDKFNYTTIELIGDNEILSFTFKDENSERQLSATLKGDSIIVYWPAYITTKPEFITPVIELPEKASIVPASGEQITFTEDAGYTVTSEAGTTRTYKLYIDSRRATPFFTQHPSYEIGTIANSGTTAAASDYFIPEEETKVYFINSSTGQEYEAIVTQVNWNGPLFIVPDIPVNATYNLRITNGDRIAISKYADVLPPANIIEPFMSTILDYGIPPEIKRGETFTVQGTLLSGATSVRLRYEADRVYYELEIIENDVTSITLKVPDDFPLGTYIRMQALTSGGTGTLVKNFMIVE